MKKIFTNTLNATPIFLSVVATIAITWYLATAYNVANTWWFLPLLAGITGISATTHPWLCKRSDVFYSWISAGCAILVLDLLNEGINFSGITLLLFIIAFFTDLCVHGLKVLHFGELLFDLGISLLSALAIVKLDTYPISIVAILIVTYCVIIMLDLNDPIITWKRSRISKDEADIFEE